MKRGAKKFSMIGRSGLDKEPARRLVKELREAGADVQVARGDVGDASVVEQAVAAIEGDIGGVVQAAMGLDVSLASIPFICSRAHQHAQRKRSGLLCPMRLGILLFDRKSKEPGTSTTPSLAAIALLNSF